MQTAQELYRKEVAALPPAEQLRLASLILSSVAARYPVPKDAAIDESDEWSDADLRDWTKATRVKFVALGSDDDAFTE